MQTANSTSQQHVHCMGAFQTGCAIYGKSKRCFPEFFHFEMQLNRIGGTGLRIHFIYWIVGGVSIDGATQKKKTEYIDGTTQEFEPGSFTSEYMKAPMQIDHPFNANELPSSHPSADFASLPPTRCHLQSPHEYRTSLQFSRVSQRRM